MIIEFGARFVRDGSGVSQDAIAACCTECLVLELCVSAAGEVSDISEGCSIALYVSIRVERSLFRSIVYDTEFCGGLH